MFIAFHTDFFCSSRIKMEYVMRLCAQSYNFVLCGKLNCVQKGDHKDTEINDENKISTNFKNFKKRAF